MLREIQTIAGQRAGGAVPAGEELRRASDVQRRLLRPRTHRLETVELCGAYLPARGLGGDYWDLFQPDPHRLGIAIGDVSGKGLPAALMLATIQGNLRGQYGRTTRDLALLLGSVNELLYEATAPEHYASLFLGEYDERRRSLRYANCGHVPPLLVRAAGEVERLGATATLLGAFEGWQTETAESSVLPGDLLLLYSDGLTETARHDDELFGESRLALAALAARRLALPRLVSFLLGAVRRFGDGRQRDDLTLLAVRFR